MWRRAARCLGAGSLASLVTGPAGWRSEASGRSRARMFSLAPSACEEQNKSPWSGYRPAFRGQVTPHRRLNAVDDSGMLPVELQGGPFKSRWLRVRHGASVDHVEAALEEAEPGAATAVYVGVPDDHVHCGHIVASLRKRGYRFHHFHDGSPKEATNAPLGELVYYRWFGKTVDLVPSYSTASEGVGVIILSPEEDAVLLVWEYGHWKAVTGSVDAGHSITETVKKEVKEEVGLELKEGSLRLVGGWQESKARDRSVNSVFFNFTAVAKSRDFQVDNVEIQTARWFPLTSLPTLEYERRAPKIEGKPHTLEVDLGLPGRNLISRSLAFFFDVHREGRGLRVSDNELNRDLFF
eukprot:TRINITY_DN55060_c0_g1_i1.p1 TRINITY_DN55060_c0_g1~~TRINITY_DN55060_c0_g1_i1.p1  ORF type:complete len:362 (+),score=60.92 TRINITY_DN55060_c0_g1_i1:33-1088(+)